MRVQRGGTSHSVRDEGMTIIEVVVGITIFFFVLTAIFGLLGATTSMAVFSNERALLVNAMNSYIEEARAMPYLAVGVDATGAEVFGDLPEETSQSIGGYTVIIRPTVEWVDDPFIEPGTEDYKQLTVDGIIMRGGEVVYTLSMSTFIRQEAPAGDFTPPSIEFGPNSPPEASPPTVVRGESVLIEAIAQATMPGARLVSMSFVISPGGTFLQGSAPGSVALWELDTQSLTKQFYWNTLAVDEFNERIVQDGEYTITIEVVDSNQKRVHRTRRVLIDNDPPDIPTDLVAHALLSGTQVPLTWTRSMDGWTETDHYALLVARQSEVGTWTSEVLLTEGPAGSYTLSTIPFSRYNVRVAGESPEGLRSGWAPLIEEGEDPVIFETRPLINGTYRAVYSNNNPRGWQVSVNLSTSQPTFPVESVRYELYERTPSGEWTLVSSDLNTTGMFTHNYLVEGNKNQAIDRYYMVRAYWTRNAASPELMTESNTLGPTSTAGEPNVITFPTPGAW